MAEDWLHRERMLLGDESVNALSAKNVLIFGIGGVGSYTLEALVRAGVGTVALVDCDKVSLTNINRQIIADTSTVGLYKTSVASARARLINPKIEVKEYNVFASNENIGKIIDEVRPDYIVDAIDTVTSKLFIISSAKERGIPVISSMGTGGKLDPTRFKIADITKTHTCPLAKVMRLKLRELGIPHCEVLFSDEPPIKAQLPSENSEETSRHIPGSVSFVPSVAGLIIAGHVILSLVK